MGILNWIIDIVEIQVIDEIGIVIDDTCFINTVNRPKYDSQGKRWCDQSTEKKNYIIWANAFFFTEKRCIVELAINYCWFNNNYCWFYDIIYGWFNYENWLIQKHFYLIWNRFSSINNRYCWISNIYCLIKNIYSWINNIYGWTNNICY